jgi:hypothetical protein
MAGDRKTLRPATALGLKFENQLFRGKALIVAPLGLLPHWKAELECRSSPPLKVFVYRKCIIYASTLTDTKTQMVTVVMNRQRKCNT